MLVRQCFNCRGNLDDEAWPGCHREGKRLGECRAPLSLEAHPTQVLQGSRPAGEASQLVVSEVEECEIREVLDGGRELSQRAAAQCEGGDGCGETYMGGL